MAGKEVTMANAVIPAPSGVVTTQPEKISAWRRFEADPADWFSAEEIAKSKAYSTPSRRLARAARAVGLAVEVAVILALVAPRLVDALDVSNWVVQLFAIILATTVIDTVFALPFQAYRQLKFDRKWGFSTQTTGRFVADAFKSLGIGIALNGLLTTALWAVIRTTDMWWLYGWGVMLVFVIGIGVLGPVLLDPIFNKFKPLDDEDLRQEMLDLARSLDADVSEVLVSDASKRDTRDNAYVTGLGKTRRVVLFDTILKRPREQLRSVVAHELGHWKLKHIRRQVLVLTPLLLVLFIGLRGVLSSDAILDLAGVDSLSEPAAVPLFWFAFGMLGRVLGMVTSYLSRVMEREADLFSLQSTADPTSFVAAMRGLYVDNLADLTPTKWQRMMRSHPPADERMAMGTEWGRRNGIAVATSE